MVDVHLNTSLALSAEMNDQMAMQGFSGVFLPFHKDIILMQFTGLKDKNGKEIYEGDATNLGLVEWDQRSLQYKIDGLDIESYDTDKYPLEVIGNVHENPELLNET